MTKNELLELLRKLEHLSNSAANPKFCPRCGQNKKARSGPHDLPCELAAVIAWLEDEANKVDVSEGRYAGVEAWLLK